MSGFFIFLTFFAAGFLAVGFLAGVAVTIFLSLGGLLVVLSAVFFALVAVLAAGFWAGVVAVSIRLLFGGVLCWAFLGLCRLLC